MTLYIIYKMYTTTEKLFAWQKCEWIGNPFFGITIVILCGLGNTNLQNGGTRSARWHILVSTMYTHNQSPGSIEPDSPLLPPIRIACSVPVACFRNCLFVRKLLTKPAPSFCRLVMPNPHRATSDRNCAPENGLPIHSHSCKQDPSENRNV